MKAIAWAMITIALFFAPEISRISGGAPPSDGGMGILTILIVLSCGMLVYSTLRTDR